MEIVSKAVHDKIMQCWWILRITYGLLFVAVGVDKFFNLVTHWEKFISPLLLKLPLTLPQLMYGIGVIEIIIGLLTLTMLTRVGAYIIAVWFGLIVINLLSMGAYFDIIARDVVMAIGAIVLAQLTDLKDMVTE